MLLLRSPVHALASKAMAVVSYSGRRSGRAVALPVQYALEGETVWVLVGRPETKRWWRNFEGGAPARLRIRGRWVDATGTVLRGADSADEVAGAFAAYRRRFPKAGRALGLPDGAEPSGANAAVAAAVLVRFDPVSS